MADTNPLFDDLGINSTPATEPENPLFSDLGISKKVKQDTSTSSPPDSDEWNNMGLLQKNVAVAKAAPRGILEGVGGAADTVSSLMENAFSEGQNKEPDHPIFKAIGHVIADRLGLPKMPESRAGRIINAGIEAAPSAALAGPEAFLPSLAPTMASGASSQTAKEAGAGPIGQTVAGLLPLAPTAIAAGVRGAVRGGEAGAANMQENLNTAQNAGINLSAGQAAERGPLRATETLGSKIPGGNALAETRGAGLNKQVEESVSNITSKLAPDFNQKPPTPMSGGETLQEGLTKRVGKLKSETGQAEKAMNDAVGKDTPMSAPTFEESLKKVTNPTGNADIDNLVTKSKTKQVSNTASAVTAKPQVATSYSTDGEGAHVVTSPNGETHAVEQANGDLKAWRSDTAEGAQGNGEGTARLEALAHVATSKGKNLVSDISVSPGQAAAYEKLSRKGWTVEKNPNAEVAPTGNLISDSPKNPVYTVRAPKTEGGTVTPTPPKTPANAGERMEWTYDPKTGKSEPVIKSAPAGPNQGPIPKAVLNPETPWTFDQLRAMRTNIGQTLRNTRDSSVRSQLGQLYGSISHDLETGVRGQGQEAESAYNIFNSTAKGNAAIQKTLTKAVVKEGGAEAVFKAAINGTKDGATRVSPIMQSLDSEGQNTFRATVLHRLGRAGGAVSAPFDANTYLSNWKNMSPEAKDVIFGSGSTAGPPTQLRKSLDSLSDTLDLLKKQGYIKSGFAKGVEQGTGGLQKLGIFGALAYLAHSGGGAVVHVAEGHPFLAAAAGTGAVGALAGNPIMSRVLTNPKTVGWLAQATKAPSGMVPVLINQLKQMGTKDTDAKDLADLIDQSGSGGSSPPKLPPQKTTDTGVRETIYPKINRSAGMQPLPGGGYGIPPETL